MLSANKNGQSYVNQKSIRAYIETGWHSILLITAMLNHLILYFPSTVAEN